MSNLNPPRQLWTSARRESLPWIGLRDCFRTGTLRVGLLRVSDGKGHPQGSLFTPLRPRPPRCGVLRLAYSRCQLLTIVKSSGPRMRAGRKAVDVERFQGAEKTVPH